MAGTTLGDLASGLVALNDTINSLDLALIKDPVVLTNFNGAGDINAGWTLLSGYLVFFMQAGFAMLCAGAVRAKNAKNIILLNILDSCFGCMAWYITGFAFAFGDPQSSDMVTDSMGNMYYPGLSKSQAFIGNRFFCMNNLPRTMYVTWFFQFTFAATGATIVSGAVAERCKFEAYMLYELMIVCLVYPVVAHWVWSPFGWLSATRTPATAPGQSYLLFAGSGVYDFAGDGPVHMVGGVASLAGAWILGPRIGRFDSAGNPVDMPGHNASLTLLGVFLLWFGWYGFNPGSTNAILANTASFPEGGFSGVCAAIAVNTTVAAATGTLSCLFIAMAHNYFSLGVVIWDLIIAGNGALAGLVSITGPCHVVDTWAAVIIGLIGGGVYYIASKVNLNILKIDDPLDAIAVHMGCGIWGILAGSAFAASNLVEAIYGPSPYVDANGVSLPRPYGFIMGGNASVLGANVVYIICIIAWVGGIMTPFFWIIKKLGLMRVAPEVEAEGLDVSLHGGSAYPHDKSHGAGKLESGLGGGISPEMVDRKIAEALEKMRLELKSSNGVPPV